MKKLAHVLLAFSLLSVSAIGFAEGDTHTVETYTKRDGTVVQRHEAGNPGSGVHCHNNVCE